MTNPNFYADEISDGYQAARRGEPFSQWTSLPWQQGWTIERRQAAARTMSAEDCLGLDRLCDALAMICAALRRRGPLAIDLAQAIALRTLEGADVAGDTAAGWPL